MADDSTSLGDAVTAGGPAAPPEAPTGLWVKASVHLPHLPRGEYAYVDPTDPQVIKAIRDTWLVPLPGQDWEQLLQLPGPALPADVHDTREPR